jgi:hypothetical protein
MCLAAVSDKPVVTRCIHLYCWPCLYIWLEPSIEDREYSAMFRGGGGSTSGHNFHSDHNDDDYNKGNGGSGPGGRGC